MAEADFAGRHVKVEDDKVLFNQEKYILEKIMPFKLPRGQGADKGALLDQDAFEAFRSLLYKVNWVAHQTRPEAAGVVSILASRLKRASVHDLCCLNKLVLHLRSTAQQCLTLHRFDNDKMIFIAASDAGGVDSMPCSPEGLKEVEDTNQGAWVILAADQMPAANKKVKVSILTWRSAKLKRRVSSTLASETLAFSQSLGEVEWLQAMFRDAVFGDVQRCDWHKTLCPYLAVLREDCHLHERLQECAVTDAKSLYDSLKKQNPTSRQDRRTSVELAIVCETLKRNQSVLRWTPHPKMIADTLTKDDITRSNGTLEELIRSSRWGLWDEQVELDKRKANSLFRGRSKKASIKIREEGLHLLSLVEAHVNKI